MAVWHHEAAVIPVQSLTAVAMVPRDTSTYTTILITGDANTSITIPSRPSLSPIAPFSISSPSPPKPIPKPKLFPPNIPQTPKTALAPESNVSQTARGRYK